MADSDPPAGDRPPDSDRLESWKEIAVYLRRGVRTVRRWEKEEGLPIHRQFHRRLGSVYAHRSELDAWREGRRAPAGGGARRVRPFTRVLMAVLPFENVSEDPEQGYIADGLTDEMISQLGAYNPERLGVIARTTVMYYRGRSNTVRQIGAELHVDYIVEGSVRREGDRVCVTAQLIRVSDQSQLWSRRYEQTVRSILVLQRELAADIGREIRLMLTPLAEAILGEAPPVNPTAYEAHLKGRRHLHAFTPESVRQSLEQFQRAIEADPTYAPAHASLAEAYAWLPMWLDAPSGRTLPLALQSAERALQLSPHLSGAHLAIGLVHAHYLWSWAKAEQSFRRALELAPGHSHVRQWYAEFLSEMGRPEEALSVLELARTYDPLSSSVPASRAFVLWLAREFDEAIAESRRLLAREPTHPMALIRLGVACESKGMYAEAVAAFQKAEVAAPDLVDSISLQGCAQARAGNRPAALKLVERLRSIAGRRYVPAFLFANVYLGLGEEDKALDCLEAEYEARGWYLVLIKQAPRFDPVRAHPRFRALLQRMNFPD